MLRSILLKTVRDQRWPVLAWGFGLGLLLLATAAGWARAYPDEASRVQFARQLESGLSAVQVWYGKPYRVDELGGFVAWRALTFFPVFLGLFLVIAATGMSRGAEERGETDVVLVAARGRVRMFVEQATGLALALAAACALIWLVLLLCGGAAGQAALDPGWAALAVLNAGLAAMMFGAFALLVAQFTPTRRAAGLIAAIVMFAAHFWNNLGVVVPGLAGLRWLSPLYLYSQSTPLADGHVDRVALAVQALIVAACATAAGWLFARRDIGAVARIPLPGVGRSDARAWSPAPARTRGSAWLLGNPLARGLRSMLGTAIAWGLGLGAYSALLTAVTPAVRRALEEQASLQDFIDRLQPGGLNTEATFLSFSLFALLPAFTALFAIMPAISWSAEERGGRLELELSCPVPRWRYFVERVGAALLAVLIVVALAGIGFLVTAWLAGLSLPWGKAILSVLLLALPAGAFAAFGYAVSAWRPGPVVAILAPALAASFFLELLAPLFNLPDAVRNVSVFRLYGQPLLAGVDWGRAAVLVALIALFTLAGSLAFARRDIAK
jgi:ABC-2 type transport system permease protein